MPNIKAFVKFIALAMLLSMSSTHAEIITDGSLGAATNLQGPDYQIGADLGTQLDTNLFHSFSSFNLLATETATFSGPDTVEHIIGRVTGGAASNVLGTIKTTIPGSQLWMINPEGWSQIGQVEAAGGLAYAPAEALRLKDGGLFRATQPELSQLTSASPQAFLGIRDLTEAKDFNERELHTDSDEDVEEVNDDVSWRNVMSTRRELQPETNDCSTRNYKELSHFTISRYRGAPTAPDNWYSSVLPPLGFEPVPKTQQVASIEASSTVRVSCNSSRCGIWENLPTP
jgi:filamentous hemagglutinin family protein